MRIISGLAGGISLSVPKGEVRPTTDRVREALFSILHPLIKHADVLDLFTGSGAFGLEALSPRGKNRPHGGCFPGFLHYRQGQFVQDRA